MSPCRALPGSWPAKIAAAEPPPASWRGARPQRGGRRGRPRSGPPRRGGRSRDRLAAGRGLRGVTTQQEASSRAAAGAGKGVGAAGCGGTVPPGRGACGRRVASAAKRRVRIALSGGRRALWLRVRASVGEWECGSVGVRARARPSRVWVGVRACEPACRRRGCPGLPDQPVARAPGGKSPLPPGPLALLSRGQVSAFWGPPK